MSDPARVTISLVHYRSSSCTLFACSTTSNRSLSEYACQNFHYPYCSTSIILHEMLEAFRCMRTCFAAIHFFNACGVSSSPEFYTLPELPLQILNAVSTLSNVHFGSVSFHSVAFHPAILFICFFSPCLTNSLLYLKLSYILILLKLIHPAALNISESSSSTDSSQALCTTSSLLLLWFLFSCLLYNFQCLLHQIKWHVENPHDVETFHQPKSVCLAAFDLLSKLNNVHF